MSDKFLLISRKLKKLYENNSSIIEENPINIKILKNLNFFNKGWILSKIFIFNFDHSMNSFHVFYRSVFYVNH